MYTCKIFCVVVAINQWFLILIFLCLNKKMTLFWRAISWSLHSLFPWNKYAFMPWHFKRVKNGWKQKGRDMKKINPKELNNSFSIFSNTVHVSFVYIDTPCWTLTSTNSPPWIYEILSSQNTHHIWPWELQMLCQVRGTWLGYHTAQHNFCIHENPFILERKGW